MVLELPTTLIDLSQMDNALARLMIETINNVLIEIYASLAQAEMEKKEKRQREGMEAKKPVSYTHLAVLQQRMECLNFHQRSSICCCFVRKIRVRY